MWPSQWEILIIFLVILLLFGAKRIPEMARGLGKGIREFRGAMKEVQEEVDVAGRQGPSIAPTSAPGQVARQASPSAPVAARAEAKSEAAKEEFSG